MFATLAQFRLFGVRPEKQSQGNPGFRSDGGIDRYRAKYSHRTHRPILACRWRQVPSTGALECAWRSIDAMADAEPEPRRLPHPTRWQLTKAPAPHRIAA
jgi:hypothetical protein